MPPARIARWTGVNHSSCFHFKPQRFAQPHQLLAVVRAAAPDAARPRTGEIVFGRQQQHPPADPHHARHLAQPDARIGQVLQHVAARHAVERFVGKRQAGEVGRDERRPIALEPACGPPQHLLRQIGAGDLRARVGILEQVLGDLAGAAADVQNRLHAAQIELAACETTACPAECAATTCCTWPASPPSDRRRRPESSRVFVVADATNQIVFDDPLEHAVAAFFLPRLGTL